MNTEIKDLVIERELQNSMNLVIDKLQEVCKSDTNNTNKDLIAMTLTNHIGVCELFLKKFEGGK